MKENLHSCLLVDSAMDKAKSYVDQEGEMTGINDLWDTGSMNN